MVCNLASSVFRSSQCDWSDTTPIFNVLYTVYIHFLSLVELEPWLGEVTLFPSSTPTAALQCSRHTFEQRFSSLPRRVLGPD